MHEFSLSLTLSLSLEIAINAAGGLVLGKGFAPGVAHPAKQSIAHLGAAHLTGIGMGTAA